MLLTGKHFLTSKDTSEMLITFYTESTLASTVDSGFEAA